MREGFEFFISIISKTSPYLVNNNDYVHNNNGNDLG